MSLQPNTVLPVENTHFPNLLIRDWKSLRTRKKSTFRRYFQFTSEKNSSE